MTAGSQHSSMTIVPDASFGVVPLQYREKGWWLLVVQHRQGHWSLPKGHPNPGETPHTTACRELFEETRCRVLRFLDFPSMAENYQFRVEKRQIQKTVTYFVAEAAGEPSPQLEELKAAVWLPIREAEQRVTFDQCRRMCQRVGQFVHGKQPNQLPGLPHLKVAPWTS